MNEAAIIYEENELFNHKHHAYDSSSTVAKTLVNCQNRYYSRTFPRVLRGVMSSPHMFL